MLNETKPWIQQCSFYMFMWHQHLAGEGQKKIHALEGSVPKIKDCDSAAVPDSLITTIEWLLNY